MFAEVYQQKQAMLEVTAATLEEIFTLGIQDEVAGLTEEEKPAKAAEVETQVQALITERGAGQQLPNTEILYAASVLYRTVQYLRGEGVRMLQQLEMPAATVPEEDPVGQMTPEEALTEPIRDPDGVKEASSGEPDPHPADGG